MNIENMVNIFENTFSLYLELSNFNSSKIIDTQLYEEELETLKSRLNAIDALVRLEIDQWLKSNVKIPCYSYWDFELDTLFIFSKSSGEILMEIHKKDLKSGLNQIVEKLNS